MSHYSKHCDECCERIHDMIKLADKFLKIDPTSIIFTVKGIKYKWHDDNTVDIQAGVEKTADILETAESCTVFMGWYFKSKRKEPLVEDTLESKIKESPGLYW